MDVGDSLSNAADYPVQALQGANMWGNGYVDGETEDRGRDQKKDFRDLWKKIKFVPFVLHVPISNAIVYAERSGWPQVWTFFFLQTVMLKKQRGHSIEI